MSDVWEKIWLGELIHRLKTKTRQEVADDFSVSLTTLRRWIREEPALRRFYQPRGGPRPAAGRRKGSRDLAPREPRIKKVK